MQKVRDSLASAAARGRFQITPRKRSPFKAAPIDAGTSTDRRPDSTVLRGMREIDSALDLEWRPMGQWWTTWGDSNRPSGASYGAWRLTVKGESGERRGMMLCPPWWGTSANSGELVAYLYAHWAPRLRSIRDYYSTTEAFSDDLSERASKERRMSALDRIDHGALRHIQRHQHAMNTSAGFSGREYFSAGMGGDARMGVL
jgi:hypothetical protein